MRVIDSVNGESVVAFAKDRIAPGSEIRTDGLTIYPCLAAEGYRHTAIPFNPKKQPQHLHWTHIIVSNAKAFLQGTFHGLDVLHLQSYLDEFCYRLNRRWHAQDLFAHLTRACVAASPKPYYALIG